MKTSHLFIAIVLLMTSACTSDPESPDNPAIDTELNLSNLQVGQKSLYVKYTQNCSGIFQELQFTGDTLIVEVVSDAGEFHFRESFTSGSTNMNGVIPIQHRFVKASDHILIPERSISNLFFFYANDTIWKDPAIDAELEYAGCGLAYENGEPFIGNAIGHVQEFYDKEDVKVISCEPAFEYDAYILYDDKRIESSHVFYATGILPFVNGFARID